MGRRKWSAERSREIWARIEKGIDGVKYRTHNVLLEVKKDEKLFEIRSSKINSKMDNRKTDKPK